MAIGFGWGVIFASRRNFKQFGLKPTSLFSGVGGLCLIATFVWGLYVLHFVSVAKHAEGTVVALERHDSQDGSPTYAPTFRFRDLNAIEYTISSSAGQSPPEFSVGQKVDVLYLSSNPRHATINSYMQLWGGPTILFVLGFIFSLAGIGAFYWPRIRDRFTKQKVVSPIPSNV
jgi:hypothetical protein